MNTLWRETRHALSGPTSADRISAWSGHQVHRRPDRPRAESVSKIERGDLCQHRREDLSTRPRN